MQKNTEAFVSYWRNSLADAEIGKGALRREEVDRLSDLQEDEVKTGILGEALTKKLFDGEPPEVLFVSAVIRPYTFRLETKHTSNVQAGVPRIVSPVIAYVNVDRKGRMYPTGKTVIGRDILEPLDQGSFSIGTVSALDEYITKNECPVVSQDADFDDEEVDSVWGKFTGYCLDLLSSVAPGWPFKDLSYLLDGKWKMAKVDMTTGMSQHIGKLYDHLIKWNPDTPLLDSFSRIEPQETQNCLSSSNYVSSRLAHASSKNPLAQGQRDALTHLTQMEEGEVLAVNGPPGTGKTTLLLSVVANMWVKAALERSCPPVIVASSTNNQAVTNIIDAFGKDFSKAEGLLGERWIPEVKSFGIYSPSMRKVEDVRGIYQLPDDLDKLEDPQRFLGAQQFFLECAKKAFPNLRNPTVHEVINLLHEEIKLGVDLLCDSIHRWQVVQLVHSREVQVCTRAKAPSLEALIQFNFGQLQQLAKKAASIDEFLNSFVVFRNSEPGWMEFLSWIPPVSARRISRAKRFVADLGFYSLIRRWSNLDTVEADIRAAKKQVKQQISSVRKSLDFLQTLESQKTQALGAWNEVCRALVGDVVSSMQSLDELADTGIRFRLFALATHYWEGRWLMEIEQLLQDPQAGKKGKRAVENRWYRRMMLAPCVVSTFYMLPSQFSFTKYENNGFEENYLYGFIDLLIVDEAGQVTPDVAAPSFSLAKRALIIGDTLQIEPIWSIHPSVDIGNLKEAGLTGVKIALDYKQLGDIGKTASSGSVMRVAQNVGKYHQVESLPRGLFLTEHRRCYDEIIQFCNALCYQGKLLPKRGPREASALYPGLGYLHIDGLCQAGRTGSRVNVLEAETIAAWVAAEKPKLLEKYGKKLNEVIGIVTPFSDQADMICRALRTLGIKAGAQDGAEAVTVGTVHSFQGAERAIIIFSPTYSKHSDGKFIDNKESMLNVAVSRAKDSFLVFGDMDLFTPNDGSRRCRSMLATYLYQSKANELQFEVPPRKDIIELPSADHRYLLNTESHDEYLRYALNSAKTEINIVSPWFQIEKLKATGHLALMTELAKKVKINIFTDRDLNNENALRAAQKSLADLGIKLRLLRKVHSKVLIRDKNLLCLGSFNWFSAQREGEFVRHETSAAHEGAALQEEIEVILDSLKSREISK